jgi:hypothetical protein
MNNKGILTRNNDDIWMIMWSDLHSFVHGTHWMYTELSSDSNVIKYLEDGEVKYKPLEEGLEVEFEIITMGYDRVNYAPIQLAKLIFPEIEEFEKEKRIKEYLKNGGTLWSFDNITTFRDGGTILLIRPPLSKLNPIYIHQDNWTLHDAYPTTNENIITDEPTKAYIFDRLEIYKEDCEFHLKRVNNIIKNIKL